MKSPVRQLNLFGGSEPARQSTCRTGAFGAGYPARPGSGPQGENCGTCIHMLRLKFKRGRVVFKCDRVPGAEVKNRHTDIRRSSPACMGWEPIPEPPVSEEDVHAYLNGETAGEHTARIERAILTRPELADLVAADVVLREGMVALVQGLGADGSSA